MKTYAGIDLHSSNNFIGVIDEENNRLYSKRHRNDLAEVLLALEPFKESLEGVVVESTYNWYWLVDGLMEAGYKVHLANPAAMKQYEGIKHRDDKWDSFFLANMLRLKILPEGYIYPKEERSVRDLLRRRLLYVHQRTSHILSFQSMVSRNLGIQISNNDIQKLKEEDGKRMFASSNLALMAMNHLKTMAFLQKTIKGIEKEVKSQVKISKEFKILQTISGVGPILGMTIMLEVGNIQRFPTAGNYSSYCRCVKSQKISNSKKKGEGNRKNGNKYLSWAYVEAANFAVRYCPMAKRFYQRKKAKTKGVSAIKALGNKLCKASYYIMRDQVAYDPNKLFR